MGLMEAQVYSSRAVWVGSATFGRYIMDKGLNGWDQDSGEEVRWIPFPYLEHYNPWKILGQRIKERRKSILVSVLYVWTQSNFFELFLNFLESGVFS